MNKNIVIDNVDYILDNVIIMDDDTSMENETKDVRWDVVDNISDKVIKIDMIFRVDDRYLVALKVDNRVDAKQTIKYMMQ